MVASADRAAPVHDHQQGEYRIVTTPATDRPGFRFATTVRRNDGQLMLKVWTSTYEAAIAVHQERLVRWSPLCTGLLGDRDEF